MGRGFKSLCGLKIILGESEDDDFPYLEDTMGTLLQIGLTIVAFFRGWGWYGVIPIAITASLGLIFGMLHLGTAMTSFMEFLDIAVIIVLALMSIKVPTEIKVWYDFRRAALRRAKDEMKESRMRS